MRSALLRRNEFLVCNFCLMDFVGQLSGTKRVPETTDLQRSDNWLAHIFAVLATKLQGLQCHSHMVEYYLYLLFKEIYWLQPLLRHLPAANMESRKCGYQFRTKQG